MGELLTRNELEMEMVADKIPSVLFQEHGNSLSVERVLRMAQRCILGDLKDDANAKMVCYEDLDTLLRNLDR